VSTPEGTNGKGAAARNIKEAKAAQAVSRIDFIKDYLMLWLQHYKYRSPFF
jgi:hypothetical protein